MEPLYIFHSNIFFVWKDPHVIKSFQWCKVVEDFLKLSSTKFSACLMPPRDYHRKVSYPRKQHRQKGLIMR